MTLSLDRAWTVILDLLTGEDGGDAVSGAELLVFDGDVEVVRTALARHARREQESALFWIRPIGVAETDRESGLPAFDPLLCRRRALDIVSVECRGHDLEFSLSTGQRAVIRPATGDRLQALQDFDTWTVTLPAKVLDDLERLDHD